jgi:AraC-like DNA-binding protein
MNESSQRELIERILRAVPREGVREDLAGVRLRRSNAPSELGHGTSFPSFCVIAQGSKELRLGDRRYRYDAAHFLVSTAALPVASRVLDASPERPYAGVVVTLDPIVVGSVMVEAGRPAVRGRTELSAIDVSPLDDPLLDATLRLVRLYESPDDARFLAPMIKREIVYRLLQSEQRDRVRQIATLGGETNQMTEAIARLRTDFDKPLRIEQLAGELGMSVSSFHHRFKEVTAMSPLQFQKQLRLQEARRLMLSGDYDATTAGYHVGYEDASHFSREYKRLFGEPPLRDVGRLRGVPLENAPL